MCLHYTYKHGPMSGGSAILKQKAHSCFKYQSGENTINQEHLSHGIIFSEVYTPPSDRRLRRASWKYALLKPSPQSPAFPLMLT